MKKPINIAWESMTGLGPAAWDSDHRVLTIHTPHHENDRPMELTSSKKRGMTEVGEPPPEADAQELQPE